MCLGLTNQYAPPPSAPSRPLLYGPFRRKLKIQREGASDEACRQRTQGRPAPSVAVRVQDYGQQVGVYPLEAAGLAYRRIRVGLFFVCVFLECSILKTFRRGYHV